MLLNSVKNNVKYLFNQKRYNLDSVSSHCDYNDVIPFSFNEIDKIVKKQSNYYEKSIHIDKIHKNTFYKFIRHTNAIIYSNTSLDKPLKNIVKESGLKFREIDGNFTKVDSSLPETGQAYDMSNTHQTDDELVCNQIERILGTLNKDNLIVVLQRALSANYYLKSKCWYKLSTKTLRHCFLNEQSLNCIDVVKMLASLSKWRFSNLSEFENKFDFYILLNNEWSIYEASQVLWSLCHLNLFTLKAFDYLNGIIASRLCYSGLIDRKDIKGTLASAIGNSYSVTKVINCERDVDWQEDLYKNIHRIASANLTRLSKTGINSSVLTAIHDYLARNLITLKCLDTKTMLSVTSLFPHGTYNDTLVLSVTDILVNSFHNFTHSQAAQILYNLSIIHSNLSLKAQDNLVKLLYKFRVLVLSSDCTFIPSVVCKLLYASRVFLSNFDRDFVSKCLSDLNANLHLIGPFSVIGNVLCLNQLRKEFGDKLDKRQKESVSNTMRNLIKFDSNGNLSKQVDGSLVPLDMKLWHLSAIEISGIDYDTNNKRTIMSNKCNINNKYNEFYETCKGENYMSTMKNLILFMANSFGNRDFMDFPYRNLTLLTCCKLYNSMSKNDTLSSYWEIIACYLQCFNLLNLFKREVTHEDGPISNVTSALMRILRSIFEDNYSEVRENNYASGITYLKDMASDRVLENDEIVIIKFWTLIRSLKGDNRKWDRNENECKNRDDVAREMFENFYSSTGNNGIINDKSIKDKGCSTISDKYTAMCSTSRDQYINRCLKSTCRPIEVDFLYTKLFFLQDHPKYFIHLVPSIIMGEALTTRVHTHDIFKIGEWLNVEKNWKCLSRYLNNNRSRISSEPSTGSGPTSEESRGKEERIRDSYINWELPEIEIKYILENQYIGAWQCPYVLKNNLDQNILIFPLKNKINTNVHIFDKIRRDVLSKYGYNFIELYYE